MACMCVLHSKVVLACAGDVSRVFRGFISDDTMHPLHKYAAQAKAIPASAWHTCTGMAIVLKCHPTQHQPKCRPTWPVLLDFITGTRKSVLGLQTSNSPLLCLATVFATSALMRCCQGAEAFFRRCCIVIFSIIKLFCTCRSADNARQIHIQRLEDSRLPNLRQKHGLLGTG